MSVYSDPPPRSGGADSWTLGSGAPPPAALTSAIGAVVSQSFEAEGVFDGECVGLSRARDGRWLHQVAFDDGDFINMTAAEMAAAVALRKVRDARKAAVYVTGELEAPAGARDVDRRVRKHFPSGWFTGQVDHYLSASHMWHISYDDGDEQYMDAPELAEALQDYRQHASSSPPKKHRPRVVASHECPLCAKRVKSSGALNMHMNSKACQRRRSEQLAFGAGAGESANEFEPIRSTSVASVAGARHASPVGTAPVQVRDDPNRRRSSGVSGVAVLQQPNPIRAALASPGFLELERSTNASTVVTSASTTPDPSSRGDRPLSPASGFGLGMSLGAGLEAGLLLAGNGKDRAEATEGAPAMDESTHTRRLSVGDADGRPSAKRQKSLVGGMPVPRPPSRAAEPAPGKYAIPERLFSLTPPPAMLDSAAPLGAWSFSRPITGASRSPLVASACDDIQVEADLRLPAVLKSLEATAACPAAPADQFLNVGGSLLALDVCPSKGRLPDGTDCYYIATAASSGPDAITKTGTFRALQMWQVSASGTSKACLMYAIKHQFGGLRDLRWGAAVPGGGDAQLGRLGVLATACCDGAVRAWAAPASGYVGAPSLLDLAPRFCASVPGGGAATAVRWSPADSALLLAASSTGSVVAWRIPNLGKAVRGAAKAVPELLLSFAPGGSDAAEFLSASIAWCPFNAALFATATVDGWLRVWNVEEGGAMTWERQLSGQPGGAQVEWMPDGRGIYAASTATGGVVGITWSEPESLVLRHAAPLTAFSVRPASASCRSTLLASAGRDGKLQVGADNGSSRGHNGNGDERPMRTWVVQQESHADAEETRPGPGGGATEKKARRLIVKTELIEVSESLYSRTDNFIRDERDGDGEKKNNTGGSKGLLLDAPSNPSPLRRIAFGRDESDGVVCAGGAGGIVRVCTLPDEILGRADPSSILRVAEV